MERADEHTALEILQSVFGDCYANCKIVDKPDIQDEKEFYGIEVTTAITSERIAAGKALCARNSTGDSKKTCTDEKLEKIVARSEGRIIEYKDLRVLSHPVLDFADAQKLVAECVKEKQRKLGTYKMFRYNQLFIFDQTDYRDEILYERMLKAVLEPYRDTEYGERKFDIIFVCKDWSENFSDRRLLYELNVSNGCIKTYAIPIDNTRFNTIC